MPLKQTPYVREFLKADFSKTKEFEAFMVKYHPGVVEMIESGKSATEAMREARHASTKDLVYGSSVMNADEDKLTTEDVVGHHANAKYRLPRAEDLSRFQATLRDFVDGYNKVQSDHTDEEAGRKLAAAMAWLNYSPAAMMQPTFEMNADTSLGYKLRTRYDIVEGGALDVLAWSELIKTNSLDPTALRIADASTRAEAHRIADEIYDEAVDQRWGQIQRRHESGESAAKLAREFDIPVTTLRSRLRKLKS